MTRTLAARLSRALVGCYPRRWRQRYADELLDVLDQHRPAARTVLNLAASAVSTHLDPAYRLEGLAMTRLRRGALISAALAAPVVLTLGALMGYGAWRESSWHPGDAAGVTALAFSPDRRILVSAIGFDEDGTDTVWNVADPAHPKQLAQFEGGAPTAISPDRRTVATISFHDQPVLWNVSNPERPAKIAALPGVPDVVLWGQAFSPDGRILAAAYTSQINLWNVSDPARPRRMTTLAFDAAAPPHWYGFPGAIAFSPDGHILASTTSHDGVGLWNVANPARAVRVATLSGHTAPVAALAFSPDGHQLADVGYDGRLVIFNLTDPAHPSRAAILRTVAGSGAYFNTAYALDFSEGGRTLTAIVDRIPSGPLPSTAADETISRWRLTGEGAVTHTTILSHDTTSAGGALALAPGGRTLARGAPSGGGDIVYLWMLP